MPKSVPAEAQERNFLAIDATCPLVTKVHREAEIHHRRGREVVLVGHAPPPRSSAPWASSPPGPSVTLVETIEDARAFTPRDPEALAFVTQTTLSVDDTREIVDCLRERFPPHRCPHKEDICYATTNRQEAVKRVAPHVEAMIVVGAPNSSNSQRLREVAEREGCRVADLVSAPPISTGPLRRHFVPRHHRRSLGPRGAGRKIIEAFAARYEVSVETVSTADESVFFPLPRQLRPDAAA